MPPISCYLCGRDFGTRSIGIHTPNCLKKWTEEQEGLAPNLRKPPPSPPPALEAALAGQLSREELRKYNREAVQRWNQAVLEECIHCKRTFFPHKLGKHQQACTEERPMTNPQAGQGLASRLEALVSYPHARSRSRGRKKCADLSCTCATTCATGGTTGCDQNSAILVEKEEEVEEKDGESVSQKTENDTDTEEDSLNHKEEDNNNEEGGGGEGLGNNLVPKEMMSFHPSMEDLVELISESGVMEEKELAAQLHFVVSYFIRVTSKQVASKTKMG